MTILVATAPFKACAPAEEFFDYPLFFPKLKFRGRPNPSDDGTEEHGRPQVILQIIVTSFYFVSGEEQEGRRG